MRCRFAIACAIALTTTITFRGAAADGEDPTAVANPSVTASPAPIPDSSPIAHVPGEIVVVEEARRAEGIPATASHESVSFDSLRARAISTADMLERIAGVDVQSFGGTGQGSFIRIRGASPAQVLVLVDGIRMNPLIGGGADLDSIPIELLERVEVARGAGAARFGADALGGVVAFRTDPDAKHGGLSAGVSSTGGVRTSGSTVFRRNGWSIDASARQERTPDRFRYRDEIRDEYRTRRNSGTQSAGAAAGARGPLADGDLSVRIWGTWLDGGSPGLSEFPTPRARHAESRATAVGRWMRDGIALDVAQRIERLQYEDPDPLLGNEPIRAWSRGGSTSAALVIARPVSSGAALTTGADVRHESVRDRASGWHARWAGGAHADVALVAFGGRFEGSLSGRLDGVAERRGADGSATVVWTPLPSAGAAWHFDRSWSIRAHGGRAYRIPTFQELWLPDLETVRGNPELRPEDAWTGDLGLVFRTRAEGPVRASAEATLFGTLLRQAIHFAPVSPYRFQPVNTGPAWMRGAELSGRIERERAGLSAAYTRTETLREETGDPLPVRPRDRVFARGWARPHPLFAPFVEASWGSPSYADFFGNLTIPGGERFGAGVTTSFERGTFAGTSVTLEGTNLTETDVRDSRYFPQPGRTFWLTITWRGSASGPERPGSRSGPGSRRTQGDDNR